MSRKNRREHLSPELTPLIDVVFLLLIFFMVSSVFKKEELALLLNLPKAESGKKDSVQKEYITIELSDERIAYESEKLSYEGLKAKVESLEKKTLINLRVDGNVKYDRLVKILDLLQKNKLENLSLITIRKPKS
ncbi:MAG: biopolymer transporter ExbD [Bacteriovoracaceae bacterium]|jgi:biopolymer transport protein ExbD|nr:biopolymer transporter ExbD [Halobacteriovoraceae bacterium]MDP7321119.1 biopolymer transporter ExbD [Bacteriovoracaceae bacterium]|tara:strand:- start:412 stop:813 length:402 start_codon:yes stop_codon:yes gene_type:complete